MPQSAAIVVTGLDDVRDLTHDATTVVVEFVNVVPHLDASVEWRLSALCPLHTAEHVIERTVNLLTR